MKCLSQLVVDIIYSEIQKTVSNKVLVGVKGFDDIDFYKDVCVALKKIADKEQADLVAKLATGKYLEFKADMGNHASLQIMENHGFCDLHDSLTTYRNFLPHNDYTHYNEVFHLNADKFYDVLLATEAANDTGSLNDFFTISPAMIDTVVGENYSKLIPSDFAAQLDDGNTFSDAFNAFYHTLFTYVEKNIARVCDQIDNWIAQSMTSDEIWADMFATLPDNWGIPPIWAGVPTLNRAAASKKNLAILSAACEFILRRKFAKISKKERQTLQARIEKYESKPGDYFVEFPKNQSIHELDELKQCIVDYASNVATHINRELFLGFDFTIINDILKTKPDTVVVAKAVTLPSAVSEDPLMTLSRALLMTLKKGIEEDYQFDGVEFCFEEINVGVKGCVKEEKDEKCYEQWKRICRFAGGVVDFIADETWCVNGQPIVITSSPVDLFLPKAAQFYCNEIHLVKPVFTDNSKIYFDVCLKNGTEYVAKVSFIWPIKPDSDWMTAFDIAEELTTAQTDTSHVPFVVWDKINEVFRAKSHEEFMLSLQQAKMDSTSVNLVREALERLPANETYADEIICFQDLGTNFMKFCEDVTEYGFFNTLKTSAADLVAQYNKAGRIILGKPSTYERNCYLRTYANAFLIAKDKKPITADINLDQCIVLPCHPAMLEKISDKMLFVRAGLSEWVNGGMESDSLDNIISWLEDLTYLHSGVDAVYRNSQLVAPSHVFGYFCTYGEYKSDSQFNRMTAILQKEAVFDDDFADSSLKHISAEAKMMIKVMMDYRKTYGLTCEHISLTFVNPSDLQVVVSALSGFISETKKGAEDGSAPQNISVKIILPENNKGGRKYLSYWMNTLLSIDDGIHIETYLDYYPNNRPQKINKMIRNNTDIVFFMDVLHEREHTYLEFAKAEVGTGLGKLECRYPMVFKPSATYSTSVSRAVDITQPQFRAATTHTQVLSYYKDPSITDERKIRRMDKIGVEMQSVVREAHNNAVWVVCIDEAIDKESIQAICGFSEHPIIGFSTGEGSFGQLNLTITTRESVGKDIKERCKNRLRTIFTSWPDWKLEAASDTCLSRAHRLDGVSVLLALNPSAYEINNFLAYLMLDKYCESKMKDYVLIRLDSYRHWFDERLGSIGGHEDAKKIPDFLVLRFEKDADGKLHIKATVTECKIAKSANSAAHITKAKSQVHMGLKVLSDHFDPESKSVSRRYWFSQLYRAIVFVRKAVQDENIINRIIDGNFIIEWDAAIMGFWFDELTDIIHDEMDYGDDYPVVINHVGQGVIQKLLLNQAEDALVEYDTKVGCIEESEEPEEEAEKEPEEELEKELEEGPEKEPEKESSDIPTMPFERIPLERVRVLIGADKAKKDVYWEFGHPKLSNRHILITGSSGQGKTYCIQAMLLELARQGISSVIFDYTNGFMPKQLEPEFKEELGDRIQQRIAIVQKIPVNPFVLQDIEIEGVGTFPETAVAVANRIRDILQHIYGFGDQQAATIYNACREGIEKYTGKMNFTVLKKILEEKGTKEAITVVNKMSMFFDSDLFDTESTFDWDQVSRGEGTVTVIQLTSLDKSMQTVITELCLWDAWYKLTKNGNKNKPFVVVLDEAQNLSFKAGSPAEIILREGRKYGWSAWFATQFLKGALDSGEISNLQQAAERLYFKPSNEESAYIASALSSDKSEASDWLAVVKNMQKGQCIVQGDRIKPNGEFGSTKPTLVRVKSFRERTNG